MSDAKPLSRDVDTMLACRLCSKTGRPECGIYPGCMKPYVKLDDYRAAAARADAERERAERLLGEMALALRDFQRGDDEKAHDRLRSALAPDLMHALKLSLIGVREALDTDDQHRAAQGEGT